MFIFSVTESNNLHENRLTYTRSTKNKIDQNLNLNSYPHYIYIHLIATKCCLKMRLEFGTFLFEWVGEKKENGKIKRCGVKIEGW